MARGRPDMRAPTAPLDVDDRPPVIRWSWVVALFATAGLLRFAYFYLDDLTRGMHGTFTPRLLEEGTGIIASALFFPIAVFAERRFPVDRGRWRRAWPPHLLAFILYSAAHTSFLALSRQALAPALGLGPYDYGILSMRYFMESAQDAFSYFTFVAILTLIRVSARLRAKEVRAAALERDAATARLHALSLRLQPHFLFNALNTISSAVYDDPAAADELIGRLGELLRASLRTGERQEISVAEELEVLRAYVSLVEARFGDRLSITTTVAPETMQLAMPAFLLQPLVENAVRHGSALEFERTAVQVDLLARAGRLELVVQNDVAGDEPSDRVGTGLRATRDRLRLLYGTEQSLEITRGEGRFRVTVRLPAHLAPTADPATSEQSYARSDR